MIGGLCGIGQMEDNMTKSHPDMPHESKCQPCAYHDQMSTPGGVVEKLFSSHCRSMVPQAHATFMEGWHGRAKT